MVIMEDKQLSRIWRFLSKYLKLQAKCVTILWTLIKYIGKPGSVMAFDVVLSTYLAFSKCLLKRKIGWSFIWKRWTQGAFNSYIRSSLSFKTKCLKGSECIKRHSFKDAMIAYKQDKTILISFTKEQIQITLFKYFFCYLSSALLQIY